MMALLLSFVLLMQNTPPDTSTKPVSTAKAETTARGTTPVQPKGTLHITFSPTDPLARGWFREMANGATELLPAYQKYVQAYVSQDKDAVKNLVTPDFVWFWPKERKPLRNEQAVKELQNMLRGLGLASMDDMHITIKKLFIKKDKAVVYVKEEASLKVPVDKDDSGTKMMSASFTWERVHIWRKTKAGWKLQTMENAD